MSLPNHRSSPPEAPPSELSFEALMEAKLRAIAEGADALSESPEAERVHAFRLEIRALRALLSPLTKAPTSAEGKRTVSSAGEPVHPGDPDAREARRKLKRRRKKARRALEILGDFARLTGELRDEVVLQKTLKRLALTERAATDLDAWRARREHKVTALTRKVQESLVREQSSVRSAIRMIARWLGDASITPEDRARAFEALLEQAKGRAPKTDTAEGAHRFRIACKKLRIWALSDPEFARDGLADVAEAVQKTFGKWRDLELARASLVRARSIPIHSRQPIVAALEHDVVKMERRARVAEEKAAIYLGLDLEASTEESSEST